MAASYRPDNNSGTSSMLQNIGILRHDASSAAPQDTAVVPKSETQPAPGNPIRKLKGLSWVLVVACIQSSTFLFAIDNTIVADIQTAIIEEFNEVGKLTWVSVAFMLGAAGTNLMWGKIYGTFNTKYVYIFTTLIFEVGSAICGAAPNMDALIIGRAICGLGGIGMYIGVMTVMSENTSKTERPIYLGLIGIVWGTGTVSFYRRSFC